jgi:hypothetical protein
MSSIAVFGVLGGAAVAAGLVGPSDIKSNAIHSRHIKAGAVTGPKLGDKVGRVFPLDLSVTEDQGTKSVRFFPLGIENSCSPLSGLRELLFSIPDNFHPTATLNWFYSDGTNTHAGGVFVTPTNTVEFPYPDGRIEGQFIFSTPKTKITVDLHAGNSPGSHFCELHGTVLVAAI